MPDHVLIVDGHSIIFAWPELHLVHQRKTAAARELLVKTLTEYQDFSGTKVVLVFDGKGASVSETKEPGGIQILYSNTGRTADAIVERLVAKYAKTFSITVATADLLEQQTAASFGAHCVGAEGLRQLIEQARRQFTSELKRRRGKESRQ
jgi:predicted RNA-binding protein with PIN domain